VRVRREDLTVFDMRRSWVKAREFATRQKAFSGFGPSWWEYRQGESKSSDQQVNSTPASVTRMKVRIASRRTDSTSGEQEFDSGVPAGDKGNVRGRHGSVKAPQGPRRSTGSPHPRR
jgi:hypothetical protein